MRRTAIATALLVPLLLAGCASDGDDTAEQAVYDAAAPGTDDGATAEAAADEEMAEEEAAEDSGDAGGGADRGAASGDASFASVVPATANRQLARTARLVVQVEDVQQGAAQVIATATRLGGFVADSQVRAGDGPEQSGAYGVITLRVPADTLDTALADLGDIAARVVDQSVSTEDLTDQLVDTQAQLRNLRALETELLELLGDVRGGDPDASELLVVFDQVNRVRSQIEQIEARRASYEDRVALATVTVELTPVPTEAAVVPPQEQTVLEEAWGATRAAFGVLGELAVWTVVTVLPLLAVLLGVPALALLAWRRARRAEETTTPPVEARTPVTVGAPGPSDDDA